jgi:sulfite exporter TauE/SafE
MLTSITPLGERGRMRRWGSTTAWYLLGTSLGGAAIGAVSGGLGAGLAALDLPGTLVLLIAAVACLVAALSDARGIRPLSWRRQVDETWLGRYRGWVVGGGFGLQLGFGVVTIVSSASIYAAFVLAVLTGSFWGGLAVGLTFGVLRAAPLLTVRRVRDNASLGQLYRRVASLAPIIQRATVAVLGLSGALLAMLAFT